MADTMNQRQGPWRRGLFWYDIPLWGFLMQGYSWAQEARLMYVASSPRDTMAYKLNMPWATRGEELLATQQV